jgi:hypothetical protein
MKECPDYKIPCPYVTRLDNSIFPCDESQGKCEYWKLYYFSLEHPSEMSVEELAKKLEIKIKLIS